MPVAHPLPGPHAVDDSDRRLRPVLDPAERTAEVLFGLIMVLTFTGSLSIAEAGRSDVREMLIAALGCNLAWGIIDGLLYVMGTLAERSRNLTVYRGVREAIDPAHARQVLATFSPVIASVMRSAELESIRKRLNELPPPPEHAELHGSDWTGALEVCLLVFLTMGPVAVPFMLIDDPPTALRTSNGVAVLMLFSAGAAYGRAIGRHPAVVGISIVSLGVVLVALTIALGG